MDGWVGVVRVPKENAITTHSKPQLELLARGHSVYDYYFHYFTNFNMNRFIIKVKGAFECHLVQSSNRSFVNCTFMRGDFEKQQFSVERTRNCAFAGDFLPDEHE